MTALMGLLNWRVWAAVALAMLLAGTHWKAYTAGQKNVQAEWAQEKEQQAAQIAETRAQAAIKTEALQSAADTLRRTKNAKIAQLDADLADALDRLHNRPARPRASDLPTDTGAGDAARGCTGKELFKDDSEFLTRIAAEADKLRTNLKACYQQYEAARISVNGN
jgi:hypothetical protein